MMVIQSILPFILEKIAFLVILGHLESVFFSPMTLICVHLCTFLHCNTDGLIYDGLSIHDAITIVNPVNMVG